MSAQFDELARAAANALVSAMVTDSWEAVRRRFAAMIGQERRMNAERDMLVATTGAARERARQEQAQAWTTRLRDALDDDPALAERLRALLGELGADHPAVPGVQYARADQQSQAVNVGGNISGNTGDVYVGVATVDKRKVNIALAPFVAFGRAARTLAAGHQVTVIVATVVVVLGTTAVAGWIAHWPPSAFGTTKTRTSAAGAHPQPPSQMVTITFTPTTPAGGETIDASARLIRQRAAHLGLPDTVVAVSGQHVVVTGPARAEAALRALAASAVLRFREVLLEAPASGTTGPVPGATPGPSPSPSVTSSAVTTSAHGPVYGNASLVHPDVLRLFDYLACTPGGHSATWQTRIGYTTPADWDNPDVQIVSCGDDGSKYVLDAATVLGEQVTSATARIDTSTSQWLVYLTFNRVGTAAFGTLTASLYNRYYLGVQGNLDDQVLDEVAIVIDGAVVSAPEIQQAIPGGDAQITGSGASGFSRAAAQELAAQLQGGYLPVSLQILSISSFTRPS